MSFQKLCVEVAPNKKVVVRPFAYTKRGPMAHSDKLETSRQSTNKIKEQKNMKWYNEVSMSFAYLVRPQISIDIDLEAYSIQLLADVIKNCFLRPGRTQSGPFLLSSQW